MVAFIFLPTGMFVVLRCRRRFSTAVEMACGYMLRDYAGGLLLGCMLFMFTSTHGVELTRLQSPWWVLFL